MRTLAIEKVLLMIPFLFMEPQANNNRIQPQIQMEIQYDEPFEIKLLKHNIDKSEIKIEILQAELETKLFFKKKTFKRTK